MKQTRHTRLIEGLQIFIFIAFIKLLPEHFCFCNTCSDSGSKASGSGDSKCKIKAEITYLFSRHVACASKALGQWRRAENSLRGRRSKGKGKGKGTPATQAKRKKEGQQRKLKATEKKTAKPRFSSSHTRFSRKQEHQGSRDFLAQIDPLLNNRRCLGRSMMFGFYQEQDVVFMSCKANFYVVRFIFTFVVINPNSVQHQGQACTVLDIAILSKFYPGVLPHSGWFQQEHPNDGVLLNALKALFSLSRVLLDLKKCILSGAK